MAPVEILWLLALAAAWSPARGRSSAALIACGLVLAGLANFPYLWSLLPVGSGVQLHWPALTHPVVAYGGNGGAALLILCGVLRLLIGGQPDLKLARRLERRGDIAGAAAIYARSGARRRALKLLQRARAWTQAAQVALELGQEHTAATMLRRAGARHLAEAAQLFRRTEDLDAAQRCEHDLAEWCMREGYYEEAIEAWLRAGEASRAVKAARIALDEGRLQPTHPAFRAARRAAREGRDHELLARLQESEGSWTGAARAWQAAGRHDRAAENFRRGGQLEEAAEAEAAAGRPREAIQLRLVRLIGLQERLRLLQVQGTNGSTEAAELRVQIKHETQSLVPRLYEFGMEAELVNLLSSSGRVEEAIQRLVDVGQIMAAAELAQEAQRWDLAAQLLEREMRWGEASDVYELAGDVESAARCAERGGELERALQLYKSTGHVVEAARALAQLGYLQDALTQLHDADLLADACALLRQVPGPVPDIPKVILDMAEWTRKRGTLREAVACLQRAVLGVAMKEGRLEPAVALAKLLVEAGDPNAALIQVERVLAYDYSHEEAHRLKREISTAVQAVDLAATRPAEGPAGAPPALSESVEQRFEILSELGRGGMGVVYRARDTRLDREVAIKVLRTTSAQEAARLEEEAKVAATLNHPGIVTIFDFEAGFGGYFIVMEYVYGERLDEILRSHPARVQAALLPILIHFVDAVAYAHEHRVIHRDLKPANILVTPSLRVKILDFGIAARLDSAALTTSGVCGTPYYMAPEQVRGEVPTPATDVYAIGATAFHLATGQPPFASGNVIVAHLKQAPSDPCELAPALDPGLGAVILRCLEKEPAKRFKDGAELAVALRALM